MLKWLIALFRWSNDTRIPEREESPAKTPDPPAIVPTGNVVQLKARSARRRKASAPPQDAE